MIYLLEVIYVVLAAASIVCCISVFIVKLRFDRPHFKEKELLEGVGVVAVDGWFKFLRGMYLLAFTAAGKSLSGWLRFVCGATAVQYVVYFMFFIIFFFKRDFHG